MQRSRKRPSGFSLLELLAVVTIMGILAVIVMPRITGTTTNVKIKVCHEFKSEINSAVERYWFNTGNLPNDFDDMDVPEDFPDGIPRNCPVDNAPYSLHPVTKRLVGHLH